MRQEIKMPQGNLWLCSCVHNQRRKGTY